MTDEDKKVVTSATEDTVKEPETTEDTAALAEETAVEPKPSDNVDYKAELAREQAARKRAEDALAAKRFKVSKDKRESVTEDTPTDAEEVEQPLTPSQMQRMLDERDQRLQKQLQQQRVGELIGKLTTNADEAALVADLFHNRVFPSHLSLEEQVEESYVLANRKRLLGENSELKRALRGKETAVKTVATAHHDAPQAGEPQLAPLDRQSLVASGFAWNGTNRRFERKFKNGDVMVYNAKTKQRTVIRAS